LRVFPVVREIPVMRGLALLALAFGGMLDAAFWLLL
jgi:hypothetical protein